MPSEAVTKSNDNSKLLIRLGDVRTSEALHIHVTKDTPTSVSVRIMTENIEAAGDIIQELFAGYLNKSDLKAQGAFPRVQDELESILEIIEQSNT